MKFPLKNKLLFGSVLFLASTGTYLQAADIALKNTPLGLNIGTEVPSSLLLILDSSGSMDFEYLPDYTYQEELCQDRMDVYNNPDANPNGSTHGCGIINFKGNNTSQNAKSRQNPQGRLDALDPPMLSSTFNPIFYNPKIRYTPPVDVDPSTGAPIPMRSMTASETNNWTAVPLNGIKYSISKIRSGSTRYTDLFFNMAQQWKDIFYCTNTPPSTTYADLVANPSCFRNDGKHFGYAYPNSATQRVEIVNTPEPYYFVMRNTQNLLWCNAPNLTSCQSKRTPVFTYPRFSAPVQLQPPQAAVHPLQISGNLGFSDGLGAPGIFELNPNFYGVRVGDVSCTFNGNTRRVTVTQPSSINQTAGNNYSVDSTDSFANKLANDIVRDCGNNQFNFRFTYDQQSQSFVIPSTDSASYNKTIPNGLKMTISMSSMQVTNTPQSTRSDSIFRFDCEVVDGSCSSNVNKVLENNFSSQRSVEINIKPIPQRLTYPNSGVEIERIVLKSGSSYAKDPARTDCAGSSCTYEEEMTNLANWMAYYRTRLLFMQSSLSNALKNLSDKNPGFNIGFDNFTLFNNQGAPISNDIVIPIAPFDPTQKLTVYNAIFNTIPSGGTPLISSLAKAGRFYAGAGLTRIGKAYEYTPTTLKGPFTGTINCNNPPNRGAFTCTITTQVPNHPNGSGVYPQTANGANLPPPYVGSESVLVSDSDILCSRYTINRQNDGTSEDRPYACLSGDWIFQLHDPNQGLQTHEFVDKPTCTEKKSYRNTQLLTNPTRFYCSKYTFSYTYKELTAEEKRNLKDPIRFSCQQNFTLLTTDGYYSGGSSSYPDQYQNNSNTYAKVFKNLDNHFLRNGELDLIMVGDVDGTAGRPASDTYASTKVVDANGKPLRPYLDDDTVPNTLADLAWYFYNNDLRPTSSSNPYQAITTPNNVIPTTNDPRTYQHMTTLTLGLGVDGALSYCPDYLNGCSADFNAIKQGSKSWPTEAQLANDTDLTVRSDDLWHAAVNGGGKYFSAAVPQDVQASIDEALSAVAVVSGAGAAAATSNLEPVAGDNFAYTASYTTAKWLGDLNRRAINLDTGLLSTTADWSAATQINNIQMSTPPTNTDISGGRTVYTSNDSQSLINLTASSTLTANRIYGKTLSQWIDTNKVCDGAGANAAACLSAFPNNTTGQLAVFKYLMGGPDPSATSTTPGYLRSREGLLGDIIDTQPIYVRAPQFEYEDAGYQEFKVANENRAPTVYVSANDGMLHAIDATNGNERWAYIPRGIFPAIHQLARKDYANNHKFFVDGQITVNDVFDRRANKWRTILVAALGLGGAGQFAMDITDPATPILLWDKTFSNQGISYGNPVIVKAPLANNDWVVFISTGYNNDATTPTISSSQAMTCYSSTITSDNQIGGYCPGDGKAQLLMIDVINGDVLTGTTVRRLNSPDTTNNSGLAKLTAFVRSPLFNNTAEAIYAGDLNGNIIKFDVNSTSPTAPMFVASFQSGSTKTPITTKLETSIINNFPVIYFGTGKFLEDSDLTNSDPQYVVAIKDKSSSWGTIDLSATNSTATVAAPASINLKRQTLAQNGSLQRKTGSSAAVSWTSDAGWFVQLPDIGERVNVDPKLQNGTFIVASNVPNSATIDGDRCQSGGYGWINNFDIATGTAVNNQSSNPNSVASNKVNGSMIVGINVVKLPSGKLAIITTTANNQTSASSATSSASSKPYKRISWRELFDVSN